jgi:aspartate carbamoyltransferase regulatory subunit
MISVDSINNGIVLDHIEAKKSMEIYRLLDLEKLDSGVAILKNVRSRTMGRKDMIKIDDCYDVDLDVLGYADPNITVNIIKDGKILEKKTLKLPERIKNVAKCKNPRCITGIEQEIVHEFKLIDRSKGVYACVYCDQKNE